MLLAQENHGSRGIALRPSRSRTDFAMDMLRNAACPPYVGEVDVSQAPPTFLDPKEAARVLVKSVPDPRAPLTVADAAAKSGLALRDAERGLTYLTHEYRGHLRVSEEGELVHVFPHGFEKPWETRDAFEQALSAVAKGVAGVARFVVRAWLTIAIFGYVGLFLAVLLGITLARQGDRDGIPGGQLIAVLFRVLADALFWTFHPFSPLAVDAYDHRQRFQAPQDKTPFYEKVNRFVFGPTPKADDPRENERRILAEIRSKKGRIGLADVMRVTGLSRDVADQRMARLMLDYDGEVDVSEGGGITYRFQSLRKTADLDPSHLRPSAPVWTTPKRLPELTGNTTGANMMVGLLNGFNLFMSFVALEGNFTLARLWNIFTMVRHPDLGIEPLGYDGVPLVLGLVPLIFSFVLFVLPLGRALKRPIEERAVARENGRLGLLREILAHAASHTSAPQETLRAAWERAAGVPPTETELTRAIVELGGDVDLEASEHVKTRVADPSREASPVRYRFADLETEAEALEEQRREASDSEAKLGKMVFSSED